MTLQVERAQPDGGVAVPGGGRLGAGRDAGVDALRVWAMGGVVFGHWLVTGFVVGVDGLRTVSPLSVMPGFAPVSWVLQTLGLFFFAGGFAAARARERAATTPDGGRAGWWAGGGFGRTGRAGLILLGGWGVALVAGAVAGVPGGTLRTVAVLVVSPLWFLVPYLVLRLATPALMRCGAWVAVPAVAVVAAVDGGWLPGWMSVLAAWAVPWVAGVAVAAGRFGRRRDGVLLAVAGAVGLLLVVTVGDYPVSAVGVPGDGRSNLAPPSLLAVCLAVAQTGVFLMVRSRHPRRRAWIGAVNRAALPVFLGHQSVLLAGVAAAALMGIPGLVGAPDDAGWVAARIMWLPVLAACLAAVIRAGGRGAARGAGHGGPFSFGGARGVLSSTVPESPTTDGGDRCAR